jgi:ATP-dependent DNA ligase
VRHQRFAEVPCTRRAEATAARTRCARATTVDGEVVAFDGEETSFRPLQQRVGVANPKNALLAQFPAVYCVFDLLEANDEDHRLRTLAEQRARLEKAIRTRRPPQVSEAWRDDSEQRYARSCRSGREGLIAKRADARYMRGRSRDWLELKCALEQEFVIGGYADSAGSRTDFGAPLVGYSENGQPSYAAEVGTGYSAQTLRSLGGQLRKLETGESSFADARTAPRGTHSTRPELVAQVCFAEWTGEGRSRQPRFLGLGDDERPAEVLREQPS